MMICRFPERFDVELKKGGRKLGFKFEKPSNQTLPELRITEVLKEGVLAECNNTQINQSRWHHVVLPEMRIEAVNEVEEDATKIAEELRQCAVAKLRIRRSEAMQAAKQKMQMRLNLLKAFGSPRDDAGGLGAGVFSGTKKQEEESNS